jgi:hypothetical protein
VVLSVSEANISHIRGSTSLNTMSVSKTFPNSLSVVRQTAVSVEPAVWWIAMQYSQLKVSHS